MSERRSTPRLCASLWAAAVLAALSGYAFGVRPSETILAQQRSRLLDSERHLLETQRALAERPSLIARARRIRRTLHGMVLRADAATSTEELLYDVQSLAATQRLRVTEIRPETPSEPNPDTQVPAFARAAGFSLQASGTFRNILHFLSALSTMPTPVRVVDARLERAVAIDPDANDPVLQTNIRIETFRFDRGAFAASQ